MGNPVTPAEKFWSRVEKNGPTLPHMDTPCWPWTGRRNGGDYGSVSIGGVTPSNRIALSLSAGLIPEGMCALHRCGARHCCAPHHLYMGTHDQNMADLADPFARHRALADRYRRTRIECGDCGRLATHRHSKGFRCDTHMLVALSADAARASAWAASPSSPEAA